MGTSSREMRDSHNDTAMNGQTNGDCTSVRSARIVVAVVVVAVAATKVADVAIFANVADKTVAIVRLFVE